MVTLEHSGIQPVSVLAERQAKRVQEAVRRERKDGLRLALRLRVAVLGLVGGYLLLTFGWEWRQIINAGCLAGLCLSSWTQYRIAGTRFDRPATMALFPIADVLIVIGALFVANEIEGEVPRVVLDETRAFSWLALILTMQALAYRPWLAAWSGLVIAIAWLGVLVWMLAYPGAHGSLITPAPTPDADQLRLLLSAFYDPLYINADIWLQESLIALLCGIILAVAVQRSQGMMSRALQAERSRANLARYFSPSMVDQLAAHDQPFGSAREQEIGVLFADMVGFTRFAETSSPDALIGLLREFHGRLARTVFDHGGTLDKFIGDCVMATFGTPDKSDGDASRTIACCRAIAANVDLWNAERARAGLAPIRIGIGAHYGNVVIGDIGDERRLEFAVLGDTVNVASRLEALTRELCTTILVSDDLVQAARSEAATADALIADFQPTAPQSLRNRSQPISLWAWQGPLGAGR